MTLWSTLFPGRKFISRTFYAPGSPTVTAPANANFMRVGMVGGGSYGFGSAFAFYKGAATPSETFALVVGARAANSGVNGNDTSLTRNTGAVLLCKAAKALTTGPGLASASTGTVKRDGGALALITGGVQGGFSGSDAGDAYEVGIGGIGAQLPAVSLGGTFSGRPPSAGGGGLNGAQFYKSDDGSYIVSVNMAPGHGRAYVEFYTADPGF